MSGATKAAAACWSSPQALGAGVPGDSSHGLLSCGGSGSLRPSTECAQRLSPRFHQAALRTLGPLPQPPVYSESYAGIFSASCVNICDHRPQEGACKPNPTAVSKVCFFLFLIISLFVGARPQTLLQAKHMGSLSYLGLSLF